MIRIKLTTAINGLLAPPINPRPITKKSMVSSSGSLIADLNLTIESAPTRPRESAIDDLITAIINNVPTVRGIKLFENFLLSDIALPYLI